VNEHSTLAKRTVDEMIEDVIQLSLAALEPLSPSPRQRALALRATSLARGLEQVRRIECNEAQLESMCDLALELHAEVTDFLARRISYRRLRV